MGIKDNQKLIMTHNSRCASAKFQGCHCSCGGTLHGGGFVGSRTIEYNWSDTITDVAIRAGIGATAAVLPPVMPIYQAYNFAKIGKELYDIYKEKNKINDQIVIESIKFGSSEVSEKISENKAEQVARGLRLAATSTGYLTQISHDTNVEENIYGSMLEGSIKEGILSGVGNFTSYTIGGLMG